MSHTCFFIAQLGSGKGGERWNWGGGGGSAEGAPKTLNQVLVYSSCSFYLSLIVLSSGIFPGLPPTTRWRAGCRGGTPSLPKSPSLRYPPGRKSHHDLSEVGASRMAQTVPPFSGGVVGRGWSDWRKCGGGCVWGGSLLKIKPHLQVPCLLAYKYCDPPSSNWTTHCETF